LPIDIAPTSCGSIAIVTTAGKKNVMTIFYSTTLVAQQKERKIDEKLGTT